MKRALAALVLTLVAVAGCPSEPVIPPPNPPVDTDWCTRMCSHLQSLKCEEGGMVYNNDLPGPVDVPNQSCSDNCVELQDKGFFVNPRCVASISSCDQVEPFRQRDPATCAPR